MSLMPHTHAGGLSYFLTAILLGLPTVVMADWRRVVVEPVMEAFQPTMVASFPRTFVELATGDLPGQGRGQGALVVQHRRLRPLWTHPPAGPARRAAGRPDQAVAAAAGRRRSRRPARARSSSTASAPRRWAWRCSAGSTTPETPRNDRCVGKPLEVVIEAAVLDEDGDELPDGDGRPARRHHARRGPRATGTTRG